jgi:hypothetical protein
VLCFSSLCKCVYVFSVNTKVYSHPSLHHSSCRFLHHMRWWNNNRQVYTTYRKLRWNRVAATTKS